MSTIGLRIRKARNKSSLTQEELSNVIGISRNYIALIETGKRKPTLKIIDDIAEATNTLPIEILKGDKFLKKLTDIAERKDISALIKEIDELIHSI